MGWEEGWAWPWGRAHAKEAELPPRSSPRHREVVEQPAAAVPLARAAAAPAAVPAPSLPADAACSLTRVRGSGRLARRYVITRPREWSLPKATSKAVIFGRKNLHEREVDASPNAAAEASADGGHEVDIPQVRDSKRCRGECMAAAVGVPRI